MWNSRIFDFIYKLEKAFNIRFYYLENCLYNSDINVVDEIKLINFNELKLDLLDDYELIEEVRRRKLINEFEEDFRLNFSPNLTDASTLDLVQELMIRGIHSSSFSSTE